MANPVNWDCLLQRLGDGERPSSHRQRNEKLPSAVARLARALEEGAPSKSILDRMEETLLQVEENCPDKRVHAGCLLALTLFYARKRYWQLAAQRWLATYKVSDFLTEETAPLWQRCEGYFLPKTVEGVYEGFAPEGKIEFAERLYHLAPGIERVQRLACKTAVLAAWHLDRPEAFEMWATRVRQWDNDFDLTLDRRPASQQTETEMPTQKGAMKNGLGGASVPRPNTRLDRALKISRRIRPSPDIDGCQQAG